MDKIIPVVYWDASAILSVLCKDGHSNEAMKWASCEGVHLMSSLAYAEVCAVISRMIKEKIIPGNLRKTILDVLTQGPWRRIMINPEWEITKALSSRWYLRGADLWHLAASKSLFKDLPELVMLTFDKQLGKAAQGEDLCRFL